MDEYLACTDYSISVDYYCYCHSWANCLCLIWRKYPFPRVGRLNEEVCKQHLCVLYMSYLLLSPLLYLFLLRAQWCPDPGIGPNRKGGWSHELCGSSALILGSLCRMLSVCTSSCLEILLPSSSYIGFMSSMLLSSNISACCASTPYQCSLTTAPLLVLSYQCSFGLGTWLGSFLCCWLWSWPYGMSSLCLPTVGEYGDNTTMGVQIAQA